MSYVDPPARMPLLLRLLLWMVEKRMGKKLLANRILTWYPKAFLGSGIMEGLVAHDEAEVPRRLLSLVRIYTSFLVFCPFCIDLNSREFQRKGISEQEILALQGKDTDGRGAHPDRERKGRAALRRMHVPNAAGVYSRSDGRFESALHSARIRNLGKHLRPGELLDTPDSVIRRAPLGVLRRMRGASPRSLRNPQTR